MEPGVGSAGVSQDAPTGTVPGDGTPAVLASLHEVDEDLAAIREMPVDRRVPAFTALHERLAAALALTGTTSDSPPGSG